MSTLTINEDQDEIQHKETFQKGINSLLIKTIDKI